MKKENNKGFMLAETLIVTTFVAGVLIFLFIQFTRLSNSYNNYYEYNSTEGLYALEDITDYIESDENIINIPDLIEENGYIEISDCTLFTDQDYCLKLLELENISKLYLIYTPIFNNKLIMEDVDILNFYKKSSKSDGSVYKLLGKFDDSSYSLLKLDGIPDINN